MTDPTRALLVVVVDRSGSMTTCRADAEGGLNALLDEHRAYDRDHHTTTDLHLVEFDNSVDLLHTAPLVAFDRYRLVPRGTTALLDAIGSTVARVGEDLAARSEAERPGTVTLVIVTDGQENSSREYSRAHVRELLTTQKRDYAWQVQFLAANLDAVAEAATFGVTEDQALTFAPGNVGSAYAAAAANTVNYRRAVAKGTSPDQARAVTAFTDIQRRAANPTSR